MAASELVAHIKIDDIAPVTDGIRFLRETIEALSAEVRELRQHVQALETMPCVPEVVKELQWQAAIY